MLKAITRRVKMMRKSMNIKAVIVLFVLFVTIMSTVGAPAFAATAGGGWSVSKASYSFLSKSQKTIFNKATKKLTGVSYKPVALLAKQTVAGTNYVFLCQGTTATAKPTKAWYILTASKSLKNKVSLRSVKKMKITSIKTGENPRSATLDGGLQIVNIKNKPAALSKSVGKVFRKGIEKYAGYELRPIALLGTQVVAGKNYRFLCYGTGHAGSDLFVVEIYQNTKGKCSLTSCRPLNLEKYVG